MATTNSNLDDRELVVRALEGDQTAVGEIYDRYSDAIYSFCRSRLRHDADAADATQDTFVRAATRLSQLREPAKLRSWLYAIARNQIVATGRASSRLVGDDAMDLIVAPDSEPDIDLLRVEASNELWDAADGLTPRDHDVLELHLRHGLVGQTLADSLGVTESHANVLLSRVRDRVAASLGGLLVARAGREDCYELDLLLASWDGKFTLDVRSRVTRHVRACDVCEQTRMRVVAGGVSFGVLPIIPAPSGLRDRIVGQMSKNLGIDPSGTAPTTAVQDRSLQIRFVDEHRLRLDAVGGQWEWMPDGFPATATERSRRGIVLVSAAAAFVLLVVLGGVTALMLQDSPSLETAAETEVAGVVEVATSGLPDVVSSIEELEPVIDLTPTIETSTTRTVEASTTTAAANSESLNEEPSAPPVPVTGGTFTVPQRSSTSAPTTTSIVSTTSPSTTTPSSTTPTTSTSSTTTSASSTSTTTTSTTTTSTTTTSTTTTSTTAAPENTPPVFGRVAANPRVVQVDQGSCQGDPTTVLAQVSDPDGVVTSVIAIWDSGKGESTATPLTLVVGATDDTYTASLGAWFVTGPQSAEIIATDDDGTTQSTFVTVRVIGCPAG